MLKVFDLVLEFVFWPIEHDQQFVKGFIIDIWDNNTEDVVIQEFDTLRLLQIMILINHFVPQKFFQRRSFAFGRAFHNIF